MRLIFCLSALLLLSACMAGETLKTALIHGKQAQGRKGAMYKIGSSYQIKGRTYYPKEDPHYQEKGMSSWYGSQFHGRQTANGEIFNKNLFSAAHRTLPLPSVVDVTNLDNGRTLQLRVNDRGPFAHERILDVSEAAAQELGFHHAGTTRVKVTFNRLATDRMLAKSDLRLAADKASKNSSYAARIRENTVGNRHRDTQTAVPAQSYASAAAGEVTTGAFLYDGDAQEHQYYVSGAGVSAASTAGRSYVAPVPLTLSEQKAQPNYAGKTHATSAYYKDGNATAYHHAAPANAASPGRYSVQVGAYDDLASAQQLQRKIGEGSIQQSGGMYKVRVGSFSQRDQAVHTAETLKSRGVGDAFVVKQ